MAFFGRNLKKVIAVETICHFRIIISHEKEHFMFILKITLVKKRPRQSDKGPDSVSKFSNSFFIWTRWALFIIYEENSKTLKSPFCTRLLTCSQGMTRILNVGGHCGKRDESQNRYYQLHPLVAGAWTERKKNVSWWIFFEIGWWWCVDWESRSSKSGYWGILRKCVFCVFTL